MCTYLGLLLKRLGFKYHPDNTHTCPATPAITRATQAQGLAGATHGLLRKCPGRQATLPRRAQSGQCRMRGHRGVGSSGVLLPVRWERLFRAPEDKRGSLAGCTHTRTDTGSSFCPGRLERGSCDLLGLRVATPCHPRGPELCFLPQSVINRVIYLATSRELQALQDFARQLPDCCKQRRRAKTSPTGSTRGNSRRSGGGEKLGGQAMAGPGVHLPAQGLARHAPITVLVMRFISHIIVLGHPEDHQREQERQASVGDGCQGLRQI